MKSEYDQREAALRIMIESYDDAIQDGKLADEFLGCLLEGYRDIEQSETRKHQKSLTLLQKLREVIRKKKKEYELPIRQIHIHPGVVAEIESEEVRNTIIRSIGAEAEDSRITADRWELFEDIAVGADLLIDASAMATGLARFIISGEVKEGIAGFGYLAIVGMGLLIAYFILRIFGEEPCKRKAKYLTHILRTPMTLHRRTGSHPEITFRPDSEEA